MSPALRFTSQPLMGDWPLQIQMGLGVCRGHIWSGLFLQMQISLALQ